MLLTPSSLPCGREMNPGPFRPPYSQGSSLCSLGSPGPRALLTSMEIRTPAHSSPNLGPYGRARDITAYIHLFFPKFHCSDSSISCCSSFSSKIRLHFWHVYNSIHLYSAWKCSKYYHLYCLTSVLNLNLL